MSHSNHPLPIATAAQPLVLSYIRFSSARQASGDSFRRQTNAARDWCARRGWTLDDNLSYQDLGVSGFNQDNSSKGALSALLDRVDKGEIPKGTYLLVENLDRLTRAELPDAVNLLLKIVTAGLICVTLHDDKEWTAESMANPFEFMSGVMSLFRGHDESQTKSRRIRDIHIEARKKRDRSIFGRAPGWLKRNEDGTSWEPIPEKVAIVRKVFELVAAGYGGHAIAKLANTEKWTVPSLGSEISKGTWHTTFASKLVRNRAVLGELEFHLKLGGRSHATGDVVADWYPRILDDELFFRANAAIDARRGKPMRRDSSYRNLFQGVAFCGHCGASMARKIKTGPKNSPFYAQYVCADRNRGVTKCPNMNAKEFENQFIPQLFQVFSSILVTDEQLEPVRNRIAGLEGEITDVKNRRERLADAIEQGGQSISILARRLSDCESRLPMLERELTMHKSKLTAAENHPDTDKGAEEVLKALYAEDMASEKLRSEIHLKMTQAVECIWIWPRELATVQWKASNQLTPLPLHEAPKIGSKTTDIAEINIPVKARYVQALLGQYEFPKNKLPVISREFVEHKMNYKRPNHFSLTGTTPAHM